jgi:flagellar protein FlaJ
MDFKQMPVKNKIVTFSAIVSIALIILGIISGDFGVLGNMIVIAVFISVGPLLVYRYSRFMRLKSIETQFPNFIRDVSDSKRSGMSFEEAVRIASKTNYGKLSPEVEKMKNRISWGTPFLRSLEIFGSEMKDSKIINEALNIVKESFKSGGRVADTLDSVATDMLMIKEAEAERSSMVKQHVMIMYGIFFMFLAISIVIIYVMIPMIKGGPMPTVGTNVPVGVQFIDPCANAKSLFPCNLFGTICLLMSVSQGISCYYTALFFVVVVLQGLFMGLIAGQLGENSITAGTKHSMIMVMTAVSVFLFLTKAGMMPN